MNAKGLSWDELWQEWEIVSEDLENNSGMFNQKEWNECSFHHIKHRGVAGGCPICLLKTYLLEKQGIEEQGY
jgi:hypothetical protein